MIPVGQHNWLFATAAWSLWSFGALLALWAFFWDRPRGRARCPKCWYDMRGAASAGAGAACPECGKPIKAQGRLFRTRRRWGYAALAALAIVLGGVLSLTPTVRSGRGWTLVPDPVLIALLPWTGPVSQGCQYEFLRFIESVPSFGGPTPPPRLRAMPDWKRRFVEARAVTALEGAAPTRLHVTLLHVVANAPAGLDVRRIVLRDLGSTAWETRWAALRVANQHLEPDQELLDPALAVAGTRSQSLPAWHEQEALAEVATLLGRAGLSDPRVAPALIDLLKVQEGFKSWVVRPAIFRALLRIGPAAAEVLPHIQVPAEADYEAWHGGDPLWFYAAGVVEGKLGDKEAVLHHVAQRHEPVMRAFAFE